MEDNRSIGSFEIGRVLAERRKALGLSQQDVNRKLRFYGYNLGRTAVSSWETGISLPNAEQFLALCELYSIDDISSAFSPAGRMSGPFSDLNEEGRAKAMDYIRLLRMSGEYRPGRESEDEAAPREIRLYTISVSAGLGEFLDSDHYEMYLGPEPIPEDADYGVRIHGDSMTPRFQDGQIVWVRQTQALKNGDIGIFYLDGNVYCKMLRDDRNGLSLLSLNQEYAPREITPDSEFRVFGLVVGPKD